MTLTIDRPVETKPAVKTVADVLEHAALALEEHGWHNNPLEYVLPDGRMCAMGAVSFVVSGSPDGTRWDDPRREKELAAEAALKDHLGLDEYSTVEDWNDLVARDAQAVTAALRAAAKANR